MVGREELTHYCLIDARAVMRHTGPHGIFVRTRQARGLYSVNEKAEAYSQPQFSQMNSPN